MKRIVLYVFDDNKTESLLTLLRDLSYVKTQVDNGLKKWPGKLSVFDRPIHVEDFKIYTREELHER